jgi:hypothetical protein
MEAIAANFSRKTGKIEDIYSDWIRWIPISLY